VQLELLALQGAAQVALQAHAVQRLLVEPRLEQAVAAAGGFLGLVERQVGELEQAGDVRAMLGVEAHPHGGAHREAVLLQHEGLAEGLQDALHAGIDILRRFHVLQQHDELVAAQAGHGVGVAHHLLQPAGHGLQQRIAHRVAQAVVDVLEAVQVHEEHGQVAVAPLGARQGLAAAVHQQGAVGQAGQRVVIGQLVDAPGLGLLLGDVREDADVVADRALLVAHRGDALPDGDDAAVAVAVEHLAFPVPLSSSWPQRSW
jgi:hypothetical protein